MRKLLIAILIMGGLACSPISSDQRRDNIPNNVYNVIDQYQVFVESPTKDGYGYGYVTLMRIYIDGCLYILTTKYLDSELTHAESCENH